MATCSTGLHPKEPGEDAPARTTRLVIKTRAGSHPHDLGGVLRTPVQQPRSRISTWTGLPHGTTRDTNLLDRNGLVHRGAPYRCIQNSCLRQGRLRARTFRTTAYLEGKPIQGQQPADESGSKWKRGTDVFRKFSVHGETGIVEPKFPRDENHIHHSLFTVVTLKYQDSFDELARLS